MLDTRVWISCIALPLLDFVSLPMHPGKYDKKALCKCRSPVCNIEKTSGRKRYQPLNLALKFEEERIQKPREGFHHR